MRRRRCLPKTLRSVRSKVGFAEVELTELRRRVNATRWPERETVTDDSQGVRLATMQELARYWGSYYDWRGCEARLADLPHFTTEIDGLDIHFVHVRPRRATRHFGATSAQRMSWDDASTSSSRES
ncbi:epoxide hydrolase N-terminal domain-containing protein [Actinomadura soli]|uniref:epoxide hydrolase N-terminal domain-containing protein n=1 Tax=Actinomadura soli TaxID=2508997 RepID=UPI00197AB1D2|nr:epoxide hydrolase N-terminal domain-containing protein [Actinomadura soli]